MGLVELIAATNDAYQTSTPKMNGVAVGIVEDIRDPKGLGRVRVRFPWLAEANEDTVSINDQGKPAHSFWARSATLMAGAKRGTFFVPEVNDEVLVAFEHGDLDNPYIVGMLWNQEDQPPVKMDSEGKNDLRAIHTRSGHKIIFNDSKDAPSILITDNTDKNFIQIDSKANTMTIKVQKDLTIEAGGKITIKAGQDIVIDAGANLEVKATGKGTVQSGGPLKVKSDATTTVEGSMTEVKGTTVAVKGSAMTEIKGGLVKIN